MYNKFYAFSEKPFEVTPDPRFLYFTPSHREALDSMIDGVKNRRGFTCVTGEAGTGKTTLVYSLLSLLNSPDEKVRTVYIFHSMITFKELLRNIFFELNLKVEGEKATLLHRLDEYLTRMNIDETIAVIIDEAQGLPEEVIHDLQVISDLEPKKIQILLVGQPELEDKFSSSGLRQLKQRIGIERRLSALSEEESKKYIDYRLRLVGSSSSETFTPEAISKICLYAKGIPRIINILCDNALLAGYNLSKKEINGGIICEVIKNMEGPSPKKTALASITSVLRKFHAPAIRFNFPIRRVSVPILFLLCLGGLIILAQGYLQRRPSKILDVESSKTLHASLPFTTDSNKLEEVVVVVEGQTLSRLTQEYYHMTNPTLIDLILDFNPEITNANLIKVNQKIKIPKITEELLITQSTDHNYKIYVGTFENPDFVRFYSNEPALKGKKIEVLPRKVSPKDTWYRVVIGPFYRKGECLRVIDQLKRKRLLLVFGGIFKME